MKEHLSERAFELLILVLSIVGAIILEQLFGSFFGGHFSFTYILFACALMLPPVVIAVLAYSWLVDRTLRASLAKLTLRIPENILSSEETRQIERKSKTTWVITTDFFWDIKNEYSKNVVIQNIKQGKKYRYFCPTGQLSRDSIAELCSKFSGKRCVEIVEVPSDRISVLFFEYVIFDANTSKQQGIIVDVFGNRYNQPDETVDMLLDTKDVLPRFVRLAEGWAKEFTVKTHNGTC